MKNIIASVRKNHPNLTKNSIQSAFVAMAIYENNMKRRNDELKIEEKDRNDSIFLRMIVCTS